MKHITLTLLTPLLAACGANITPAAPPPAPAAYLTPEIIQVTVTAPEIRPCLASPPQKPPQRATKKGTLSENAAEIAKELWLRRDYDETAYKMLAGCHDPDV